TLNAKRRERLQRPPPSAPRVGSAGERLLFGSPLDGPTQTATRSTALSRSSTRCPVAHVPLGAPRASAQRPTRAGRVLARGAFGALSRARSEREEIRCGIPSARCSLHSSWRRSR